MRKPGRDAAVTMEHLLERQAHDTEAERPRRRAQ